MDKNSFTLFGHNNILLKILSPVLQLFTKLVEYYKDKWALVTKEDRFSFIAISKEQSKPWYKNLKKLLFVILFLLNFVYRFFLELILILIFTLLCVYLSVGIYSNKYTYSDISSIEKNDVALVLGTSKYVSKNKVNKYYSHRISAAYDLYKLGKVNYILVSGDNRSHRYNEPQTMFNDLIHLGVPEDKVYLDYAGFRTYDSIVRANKVFGQSEFTVVSQKFHNERAIFIARSKGIDAIGYNAADVKLSFRLVQFPREILSRALMYFDLIIGRHPRFYGEPVIIGVQ